MLGAHAFHTLREMDKKKERERKERKKKHRVDQLKVERPAQRKRSGSLGAFSVRPTPESLGIHLPPTPSSTSPNLSALVNRREVRLRVKPSKSLQNLTDAEDEQDDDVDSPMDTPNKSREQSNEPPRDRFSFAAFKKHLFSNNKSTHNNNNNGRCTKEEPPPITVELAAN